MTEFRDKLEKLLKQAEEMVAKFAKSAVIQNETESLVEGFVYANVIANFKRNLTERNAREYGLSKDDLRKITKELKGTYDACAKIINTASNKERVNSDYYQDFRNRIKALNEDCFRYLLELEKAINGSSCEKRIKEFKKKAAKLGTADVDAATWL